MAIPLSQLLSEMYPQGIPPSDYTRVVTLITRVGLQAPAAPRAASTSPPPRPRRSGGGKRGRPPTGTAVADRMTALLQSRGAMAIPEIARELDVHTASVYTAIPKIRAERVEEGGQTLVRLPATVNGVRP